MLSGSLKSITYPTGGKTEFTFEPHVARLDYPEHVQISKSAFGHVEHLIEQPSAGVYEHTETFTINNVNNQVLGKINYESSAGQGQSIPQHYKTTLRLRDLSNGNILFERLDQETIGTHSVWLKQGHSYEIFVRSAPVDPHIYTQQGLASLTVEWNENAVNQIIKDEIIGGLRIAKIENFDSDHTTSLNIKSFEYVIPNDPSVSSGLFNQFYRANPNSFYRERVIHREYYPTDCMSCQIHQDLIVSMTANPTSASGFLNNPVNYQYVTTYDGIKSGGIYPNGKTTNEFSVAGDFFYQNYGGVGEYNSDRSYRRGLLKNQKIYDSANAMISETSNTYDFINMQNDISGIHFGPLYDIQWADPIRQEADDHCLCPLVLNTGNGCTFVACHPAPGPIINDRYQFKFNSIDPVIWVRLKSKSSTTDGVSTIEEFTYNLDGQHSQPIEVNRFNSDGTKFITKTKFVRDFDIQPSFANSSDWRTQGLYLLSEKNMNPPVERLTYSQKSNDPSPRLISSSLLLYKIMNGTGVPLLHEIWGTENLSRISNFVESDVNNNLQFIKSNHYQYQGIQQPTYVITDYNDKSQMKSFHRTYDIETSIIWDAQFTLPVAKTLNAQPGELAFTSFESYDGNGDNWIYSSFCSKSSDAKVGHKKLKFSSSCTSVSKSNLNNGDYTVGFWAKSSTNSGSKIVISGDQGTAKIIGITKVWTYYEARVENTNSVSLTSSGTGTKYLDELRLFPHKSRMETYTYFTDNQLLAGTADINGKPTTFEYDEFQRLKVSRDFEGNIIDAFEYHYKNGQNDHNWVKNYVARQSGIQSINDFASLTKEERDSKIEYIDGIGRTIQTIGIEQAPSGKDVIQIHEFDHFGRMAKEYLPFSRAGSGAFVNNANILQNLFYGNLNGAYAYNEFDYLDAPLHRVLMKSNPGKTWKLGSGREIETQYRANNATEVRVFRSSGISTSFYNASELLVKTTIDENDNQVIRYYDKLGREILINNNGSKTYKVYNDFGKVIYVIPPKATEEMETSGVYSCPLANLSNSVFKYTYDKRRRMINKRIPGKKTEYFYYDKLDRLVMTKDGNGNKVITKYDELGKTIIVGLYNGFALPSINDGLFENRSSGQYGYTLGNSFPSSNIDVLSVNYYDDYDFNRNGVSESNELHTQVPTGNYNEQPDQYIRDRTTASKISYFKPGTKIIEGYIFNKSYFDSRGRVIQTEVLNHTNEKDLTYNKYNFSDLITSSKRMHRANLSSLHSSTIEREFKYDHFGRLIEAFHSINGSAKQMIYKNSFNDRDELKIKRLGATDVAGTEFLQTVNYNYNIRGWMTSINSVASQCMPIIKPNPGGLGKQMTKSKNKNGIDSNQNLLLNTDLFAIQFHYDAPVNMTNGPAINPQFNGNIASMIWQTGCGNTMKYYGFEYDNKNQLVDAFYGEGQLKTDITNTSGYDMHATYDLNGNIKTLTRRENSTLIDHLQYDYDKNNQLSDIEELSSLTKGFKSINSNASFDYDNNGNMTRDNHKEMNVHYNFLNLPSVVEFDTQDSIIFRYDALGTKISKLSKSNNQQNWTVKNYFGEIEYENDVLLAIYHEEGRVTVSGNQNVYEYNIKDHLGNSRVMFSDLNNDGKVKITDGEIIQENHYYPFGMSMSGNWSQVTGIENPYQYNGKELNTDFDLNWLDYGARWYDPSMARWNTVDPLAENHFHISPYNYVLNNPMIFIDPDGQDTTLAKELTKAAENAVEAVEDDDPEDSQPARCNVGVCKAFRELTANSDELDKSGNIDDAKVTAQMVPYFENNSDGKGTDNWEEIEIDDAQDKANDGDIVIIIKNGHVVMAVPGDEISHTGFGGTKIPNVMDTGSNKRTSKKGLNYSWGSKNRKDIKAYRYTFWDRTFSGGDKETVTVKAKRTRSMFLPTLKTKVVSTTSKSDIRN
ncbi:MAG: RHS repeat-associated core domain-containing protein [Flavobacteriales bacterium]|nr:RHS repeat-associated core domain-containing protein [Flavobacteriales bacterium]